MSDPAGTRISADAFIAWAMGQKQRYELHAGIVVAMAPERSGHALMKLHIARRLHEAVRQASLACDVYPDGMAVEIDDDTVREPDALVGCGLRVPPDRVKLTDPVIVVEVLSPTTRARDVHAKLTNYFRLPSVQHYVIVPTDDRPIVHHARHADETILTRTQSDGTLNLDPTGLTVTDLCLR